MLAYYVEWHLRDALAPILFDDHQRAGATAKRSSTADALPVHSFHSLFSELAIF
jgi:hypothetical protein